MSKIISDKCQKYGKHEKKEKWWSDNGIEVLKLPLPCGDYILVDDKVQDLLDRKEKRGVAVKKMDFLGSYSVTVDSKRDMNEIVNDICGVQHERFRDELLLAQNNGIKLYILVEDDGGCVSRAKGVYNKPITCVEDVFSWINPRLWIYRNGKQAYPNASRGSTVAKVMKTLERRYGCTFVFCKPEEAGKKILELLTQTDNKENEV